MNVILDKLRCNCADFDKKALSHYIRHLCTSFKDLFAGIKERVSVNKLDDVFHMMEINNFGRAMTFLTLTYVLHYLIWLLPNMPRLNNRSWLNCIILNFDKQTDKFSFHKSI